MKKIMIMAAGTGGHVFPGIALAEEFKKQDVEVCWLGTIVGMEKQWVENAGIPFQTINIKGLRGNGLVGWLIAPVNVVRAILQAIRIIKQQQPDVVLGMGGFVCGPGGIAAKLLGLTLILHEQNAIPGLTNRLLSKIADRVITAFPQQQIKSAIQIGNPVRAGLEQLPVLTKKTSKEMVNILVLGGSRGALAINQILPSTLKQSSKRFNIKLIHQTGKLTLKQTKDFYQKEGIDLEHNKHYEVTSFLDNMVEAYRQADLVVCRSGALTVSELIASARPAIMIPYPLAVDDHQTANAGVLVDLGGGEIIQQKNLTTEVLTEKIIFWLEFQRNINASEQIRQHSTLNVTSKVVEKILSF